MGALADDAPRYPYLRLQVSEPEAEHVSWQLWELGAAGIEQRDAGTLERGDGPGVTLIASFEHERSARAAARRFARRHRPRIEHVVGDAWRHAWREFVAPVRLGRRLVVRPSWTEIRLWPEEVELTIDPENAFGSGAHETTRLVLRELDRRLVGGEHVLDVGCGSGILSIAALKLGAARARAVDVDPDAVVTSLRNARRNGVVSRLTVSATPVERLRGRYDVVLANIQADVLVPMADALLARLGPRGLLVMSGVLVDQRDAVLGAFPRLRRCAVTRDGEWVGLTLRARR